ncbi:SDR family oxidoreductase [Prosthecobacter sp.]|uniref:SDR family oxidoreductase n=1 Tax=Prosthecobacter sp. TaxID=1965333 RepID=UPI003784B85D
MKTLADPRDLYPRPPYASSTQPSPGSEKDMLPVADHGETSYVGSDLLKGRRALITGADSGIGRAVAIAFAREGADVAISYLSEHDDAHVTAQLVKDAGRKAVLLPGDLNSKEACDEMSAAALRGLGGVDILVNNAAFQRTHQSLAEVEDAEWMRTYEVNVFAMVRLCRSLLPQMVPGSSIINTASIQAFDPSPNLLAYASTKAAIVSFTRSMAHLAIQQGVRVNAVAPGPVWTPLIPSTMTREKVKMFGAHTAFGRAAQPAEISPIFVFLAGPHATYVTGEVYGATGGQMPL